MLILKRMIQAPLPDDEALRLETLRDYDVSNKEIEQPLERLVNLAARVFDVPIAIISLVDEHRLWAKACVGVSDLDGRRSVSFCGHTILSDQTMVVLDTAQDERFFDNPLVTSQPHIRFYAGAPLIAPNGAKIGTLCVLDQQPRSDFSQAARDNLRDLAAAVTDALELRRVNARLRQSEAMVQQEQNLLTETFAALEEGVVVQDASGQIISANASAARVLGLSMDQLLGRTSFDPRWRAVRKDGTPFAGEDHPVPVALRDGVPVSNVLMGVHHSDARLAWVSINARPLFRRGELKPYAAVGSFKDVTEQHERQTQLEFRVGHDALTGLPNREAFMELLEQPSNSHFVVGFLDLNDFKLVNDRFGHSTGDELLKQVARRLGDQLRSGDVVARLGGDEFALYLPQVRSEEQLAKVTQRIQTAFTQPFGLDTIADLEVNISFGAAFYPSESRDPSELMHLADMRMYESKLAKQTPRKPRL